MILKYYGGYLSIDTLSELCKTARNGTSAYHIIKAASELGFIAEGIRCNMETLIEKEVHFPVIAHVIVDKSYLHYIVIYEINKKGNYFIIADPAVGIQKIGFSKFETLYNHTILTFIPQKKLPLEKGDTIFQHNLYSLFLKYKKEWILFLFLSFLFTMFSMITTFYLSSMTEGILYQSYSYLLSIFILFLLLYICKAFTQFFKNLILIYIHTKIDFVLSKEVFHHILLLPYSYYKNHTTGDVISRINDLEIIKNVISKIMVFCFIDLFLAILSFFLLWQIKKVFHFIALSCFISYVILSVFIYKRAEKKVVSYQRQKSETFNYLFESVHGFESIKGLHLEVSVEEKYQKEHLHLLEKTNILTRMNIKIGFIGELIEMTGFLLLTYFAFLMMMKNSFSTSLLFTSLSLYEYCLSPIKNLLVELPTYKEALSSFRRVQALFVKSEEVGFLSCPIEGKIEVKNLSYAYLEDHPILSHVSFSIEKGEKVLFLGKSGAGKSTFLKLLKKYYQTKRGSIFIDGIDLVDYTKEQVDKDICYISQNETLFTGSLYENITFGKENKKWFTEVIKICELDPILKKDSLGIYQFIEEGGYHLSGGEKQRIILARALMRPFYILLIDEGFSALDPILERKIIQKLFNTYLKKTVIIVSHRMDNIDLYDKVIQFEKIGVTQFKRGMNGKYRVV